MNPDTLKVQKEIDDLQKQLDALGSSTKIPFNIEVAFRTRLGVPKGFTGTITTAKLSALGSTGSMTFVNGTLTAQTPAT